MINSFDGVAELREALVASCCMTPLAGWPFQMKRSDALNGSWVVDGGLTAFQPSLGEGTITVSPFYWAKADIIPSEYIPMIWAIYPPKPDNVKKLYALGYRDAKRWWYERGPGAKVPRPLSLDASSASPASFKQRVIFERPETAWNSSSIMGDISFIAVHAFVKPAAYGALYVELASRAYVSAAASGLSKIESFRRSLLDKKGFWPMSLRDALPDVEKTAEECWEDVKNRCTLMLDPSLVLGSLPFRSMQSESTKKKMEEQSLVYRCLKYHTLAFW